MRGKTTKAIILLAMMLMLISCRTVEVQQISEEPAAVVAQVEEPKAPEKTESATVVETSVEKPVEAPVEPAVPEQSTEPVVPEEPSAPVEPIVQEEPPKPEPTAEPEVQAPLFTIGQVGPNGGLVFEVEGRFRELCAPKMECSSYEDAVAYCASMSEEKKITYRLPTIIELLAIYNQLVVTELSDVEWTYYWSSEQVDEKSAKVLNFDTGFEGSFYRDMDFVGALPVTELN